MTNKIPRGVWFDEAKQKWRVRLYKNGKSFTPRPTAFFDDLATALIARKELKAALAAMPRAKPAETPDLYALWQQCIGISSHHRVTLLIQPENIK